MSIYSWSIGHILEHEFFCLGCLGWAGSKEKKWFCLLLNLWDSSFTYLFAAEPFNFLYCWTFEIMPWIMYLFTAEPLDFFYCWTFEIMPWIMYLFDAEALRTFSSKQNHQKSGPLIKLHESETTDISIIPAKI